METTTTVMENMETEMSANDEAATAKPAKASKPKKQAAKAKRAVKKAAKPVAAKKADAPAQPKAEQPQAEKSQAEQTAARPAVTGPTDALGQIVALMMQSPAHEHMFLSDMKWLVAPAVALRQFRIFRTNTEYNKCSHITKYCVSNFCIITYELCYVLVCESQV